MQGKQWAAGFWRSCGVIAALSGNTCLPTPAHSIRLSYLADFLDGRAAAFLPCPLMLQKWTVR